MQSFFDEPLISVLVPMYNVEKYVARCIKSIVEQTYTNLEIVLLDDGSKDKTYEIAEEFAKNDKRIKLITKQNEANISLTRNYLLKHFSGEYFMFVDSDDIVDPKYVEKLYTAMEVTGADIVSCKFSVQKFFFPNIDKQKSKHTFYYDKEIIPQMILNNEIGFVLWNKIYKKTLLNDTTFSPNVRFGEDLIFLIKYLKNCKSLVTIDDKLYHYMLRTGSEIHQKYSSKHASFIKELVNIAENETDEEIASAIKAWISFSSVGFCFLAKFNKEKNKDDICRLSYFANLYKSNLLSDKRAKGGYKIIEKIGLATWCKKDEL